jgi:hypothetical protein
MRNPPAPAPQRNLQRRGLVEALKSGRLLGNAHLAALLNPLSKITLRIE